MLQLIIPYKDGNYKLSANSEQLELISNKIGILKVTLLTADIIAELLEPAQLPALMISTQAVSVKVTMQTTFEIPGSTPSGISVSNRIHKFAVIAVNENIKEIDLADDVILEITKNQEINIGQIIIQELSIIAGFASLSY